MIANACARIVIFLYYATQTIKYHLRNRKD